VAVLTTSVLEVEYTDEGAGFPVMLVHGWPDAARGWDSVRTGLLDAGLRVIVPSLRGSGRTQFVDDAIVRDGTACALAQDVLELADGLALDRFAVVGHDWGARVAFTLAAVAPRRLTAIVALALAYQPHGAFQMPASFVQSRLFWYQWLMYVDAGAATIAADPIGFAREQWDTWSPAGWYADEDFTVAADSFRNRGLGGDNTQCLPVAVPRYRASGRSLRPVARTCGSHQPSERAHIDAPRRGGLVRPAVDVGRAGRLLR
jgi:pimeloyl-ACP methyl ester carboxylesterase